MLQQYYSNSTTEKCKEPPSRSVEPLNHGTGSEHLKSNRFCHSANTVTPGSVELCEAGGMNTRYSPHPALTGGGGGVHLAFKSSQEGFITGVQMLSQTLHQDKNISGVTD